MNEVMQIKPIGDSRQLKHPLLPSLQASQSSILEDCFYDNHWTMLNSGLTTPSNHQTMLSSSFLTLATTYHQHVLD